MPAAPAHLQSEWETDDKAIGFLEGAGYKLLRGWTWQLPSPAHVITDEESRAINYLIWEWDFGGVAALDS